jgi:hypothetical protein
MENIISKSIMKSLTTFGDSSHQTSSREKSTRPPPKSRSNSEETKLESQLRRERPTQTIHGDLTEFYTKIQLK